MKIILVIAILSFVAGFEFSTFIDKMIAKYYINNESEK